MSYSLSFRENLKQEKLLPVLSGQNNNPMTVGLSWATLLLQSQPLRSGPSVVFPPSLLPRFPAAGHRAANPDRNGPGRRAPRPRH
jgi:hypothetical protein